MDSPLRNRLAKRKTGVSALQRRKTGVLATRKRAGPGAAAEGSRAETRLPAVMTPAYRARRLMKRKTGVIA